MVRAVPQAEILRNRIETAIDDHLAASLNHIPPGPERTQAALAAAAESVAIMLGLCCESNLVATRRSDTDEAILRMAEATATFMRDYINKLPKVA